MPKKSLNSQITVYDWAKQKIRELLKSNPGKRFQRKDFFQHLKVDLKEEFVQTFGLESWSKFTPSGQNSTINLSHVCYEFTQKGTHPRAKNTDPSIVRAGMEGNYQFYYDPALQGATFTAQPTNSPVKTHKPKVETGEEVAEQEAPIEEQGEPADVLAGEREEREEKEEVKSQGNKFYDIPRQVAIDENWLAAARKFLELAQNCNLGEKQEVMDAKAYLIADFEPELAAAGYEEMRPGYAWYVQEVVASAQINGYPPVISLVGPPGTGKSQIISSLSKLWGATPENGAYFEVVPSENLEADDIRMKTEVGDGLKVRKVLGVLGDALRQAKQQYELGTNQPSVINIEEADKLRGMKCLNKLLNNFSLFIKEDVDISEVDNPSGKTGIQTMLQAPYTHLVWFMSYNPDGEFLGNDSTDSVTTRIRFIYFGIPEKEPFGIFLKKTSIVTLDNGKAQFTDFAANHWAKACLDLWTGAKSFLNGQPSEAIAQCTLRQFMPLSKDVLAKRNWESMGALVKSYIEDYCVLPRCVESKVKPEEVKNILTKIRSVFTNIFGDGWQDKSPAELEVNIVGKQGKVTTHKFIEEVP